MVGLKAKTVLAFKVRTNCDPTKPYNKSLINLGLYGKVLPSVFIAQTSLLRRSVCTKNLRQYFPVQTSQSVNKSLVLTEYYYFKH
jgi:hypothetical protein